MAAQAGVPAQQQQQQQQEAGEAGRGILRLLISGDFGIGKTSLVYRFTEGAFMENYPDAPVKERDVEVNGRSLRTLVIDPCGQEKFSTLTRRTYSEVDGAMFVFDVTKQETFDNVANWHEEMLRFCNRRSPVAMTLVANKLDLLSHEDGSPTGIPRVDPFRAKDFAGNHGMSYFEVSAHSNTSVVDAFADLIAQAYLHAFPADGARATDQKSCCCLV